METKESVCAVVVTFNRKNLLIECLEALRQQTRPIQAMYIIDNFSTDGTPQLLFENGYIKELPRENLKEPWEKEFNINNLVDGQSIKVHYVRMHENTGGAGGFHEGVKRGYERGYDWLWLMDDDAEPKYDALEILLQNSVNYMVLSNLKVGIDNRPQFNHRGWKNLCTLSFKVIKAISDETLKKDLVEIDHSSFVGFFINRKVVEEFGFPKKEFFIYYDDVEYSFRINKKYKILMVSNSIIYHKDANKKVNKGENNKKSIKVDYKSFWLKYFYIRNLVYLKKRDCILLLTLTFSLKVLFKMTISILAHEDHKLKRIIFVFNAIIDGLVEKFDNTKAKKLLYD